MVQMQDASNPGVPKALANDNWYGYVNRVVVEEQVHWIEMAVVLPFWNNMVVYYVEGDRGHLMGEQIGGQRHRWGVRGNCFSYHMPWEDILRSLGRCVEDTELQAPLPQDVLVHLVRLHMKVGEAEWAKHLRQVKLRAHVALRLACVLIDNKHPAFRNKGSAVHLKARFERVLREQYPDSDGDGRVPQRILEACKESLEGKTAKRGMAKGKHAAPDAAPDSLETALDCIRPHAILAERSSGNIADGNDQRSNALSSYAELSVQTGSRFI